jgi:DNA-binding transcriptional MerR regulator
MSHLKGPEEAGAPEGEAGLIKIGDFAKLAGTNLRTLRYYEEIGLLRPASRSTGGFRYYRREDLDRLRMVARLQELGLELARIRDLMSTRVENDTRAQFLGRVRRALDEQLGLIQKRVRVLNEQIQGLERAMTKLTECDTCRHTPSTENNFCHPCVVDRKDVPFDLSALY